MKVQEFGPEEREMVARLLRSLLADIENGANFDRVSCSVSRWKALRGVLAWRIDFEVKKEAS